MADGGRRTKQIAYRVWRAVGAAQLVAFAGVAIAQGGPADAHFALVRPRFDAAHSMETVAYLDRYVRWPGNAGFDSSIMHVARQLAAAGYVEQPAAKRAPTVLRTGSSGIR